MVVFICFFPKVGSPVLPRAISIRSSGMKHSHPTFYLIKNIGFRLFLSSVFCKNTVLNNLIIALARQSERL